jgi:hypothetical protein
MDRRANVNQVAWPVSSQRHGPLLDRELSDILDLLETLRAKSKHLGKDHQRLFDHVDEAVSQLNQAASELAGSRAEAEQHRQRRYGEDDAPETD